TVEIGAAMRVRDDDVVSTGRLLDRGADPFGPVVELRRDGADLQVPAAPRGDPLHVERKRSAADDDPGHPAKASRSTARSLKPGRPGRPPYWTAARAAGAAARSVTESAAIFAPSPGTLPAATSRASGSAGPRPIRTALVGVRYAPNAPPSSTCEISSGSI